MATYFVASGGSNTAPYETWAKAATSLQTALTAASTNGDIVVIQHDGVPTTDSALTTPKTYTFAADVSLISSTSSGTDTVTPTVMGDANWIGASSSSRSITMSGAFAVYVYGITLRNGAGTIANHLLNTDGGSRVYAGCTFWIGTTNTQSYVRLGMTGSVAANAHTRVSDCVFRFNNANQGISSGGGSIVEMQGCSIHGSSVAVNNVFLISGGGLGSLRAESCDFTGAGASSTIVSTGSAAGLRTLSFSNCTIGASATWLAAQTPASLASSEVFVYNCSGGDTHFNFGYYNALGEVTAVTSVVANGAKFDGTNAVSWRISTTAAASEYVPFITPWIEKYHSGTTGITPSLEICRSGSATAYNNNQVWGEFGYQGSTNSTLGLLVNDRAAIAAAGAAQDTGVLTGTEWVGEDATSWFGKLNPTSAITPSEIGTLRARVYVGVPSISDLFVDPFIRTT